jgi:Kef-type K+ transport system membrane component KefB
VGDTFFALTIMAWLAYLASRVLRRSLPEFIAFLLVGVLLGPEGFGLIDRADLARLSGVTGVALAILMFIIGERVSLRALRARRWVPLAGIVQYVVTAGVVFAAATSVGADRDTALLLGALGGAGAPLTVAAVAASLRARGQYAEGLVGVHAVADALAAMVFAAVLAVLAGTNGEAVETVGRSLRVGAGGVVLGTTLGWVIARFGAGIETTGELLLFVLVQVVAAAALADVLGVSLPLAALTMGSTAASLGTTDAAQRTFVAARSVEQPLYLLFFALAGASIHLGELASLGLLGLAYLLGRVVGKIVGGFLGGAIGRLGVRRSFALGMDLIPQAGVAVGLAVLAAERLPGPGSEVASIVLGSVVIFELVGPMLVVRDLKKEAESPQEPRGSGAVDHQLPRHVLVASAVAADVPDWVIDLCARNHAELTVAVYGEEGDDVAEFRSRAGGRGVPFRFVPLQGESYTGAVIRAAREATADLVVLLVAAADANREARLVLLPHERVARHLTVPVLFVPAATGERSRPGPLRRLLGDRLP